MANDYTVKFKLGGGWDIGRKLEQLASEANSGPMREVHDWSAQQILELAKSYCPVHEGQLRDSLYIKTTYVPVPAVHNDLAVRHYDDLPQHNYLAEVHNALGPEIHNDIGPPLHFEMTEVKRGMGDTIESFGGRRSGSFYNIVDEVTSDLPYAGVVEFGNAHQAAQPYLRPAIDAVKAQVSAMYAARSKNFIASGF